MIENIVQGINIVVIAIIIFLPIIIGIKLNKVFNNNFWMILFGVLCILVILVTLGVYWYDELSKRILLTYYGFNEYLMMDGVAYENVKPENISRVNEIYNSMFGVSWVLKAFFTHALFSVPYGLIVSLVIKYLKINEIFKTFRA